MSAVDDSDCFAPTLLAWFDDHGRHDLPWQNPATPYRVWISEVMLQQTQVATVIAYFERFMQRFPDLAALADASLDEVLSHWSGLGYYARARNLHACARLCVERYDGALPRELDALIELPGIGRSTAGAIHSLAFGGRAPILDGNVKRVLARVHAIDGWPGRSAVSRTLWSAAESGLPDARCGDYNQALMDLGATVCKPTPECPECPLRSICRACQQGDASEYPGRKPARKRPLRQSWALLLRDRDGALLLQRRPPHGVWGGLWSPPLFETRQQLDTWLAPYPVDPQTARVLAPIRHGFTHFEMALTPLLLALPGSAGPVADGSAMIWWDGGELPGGTATPIRRLLEGMDKPIPADYAASGAGPDADA